MAFYVASNGGDRSTHTHGAASGAALIHVPASVQQAPGALRWCPVCGQMYNPASVPAFSQPRQAEPDEYQVLCCLDCGTYAVGVLAATSEESRVPSA